MGNPKSISRRGKMRRAIKDRPMELQLTALIDILVIILVFLLKTYDSTAVNFSTPAGLELPLSKEQKPAEDALNLFVSIEKVTLGSEEVIKFVPGSIRETGEVVGDPINPGNLDEEGRLIVELYDLLKEKRTNVELVSAKTGGQEFSGVVNLVSDKRINYSIIKKILYTAAAAGYVTVKFAVQKQQ